MSVADKLLTVAENVPKVYNAGYEKGKSESVSGMTMANYASEIKFRSDDWATSDTVVLDMPNLSTMNRMFSDFDFMTIKHLTINSNTPITNLQYAFGASVGNSILKTIVLNIDTSECTAFGQMLFKTNVRRIEGNPIDFSSATSIGRVIAYDYSVEYFRVVPNTIKLDVNFGHCGVLDDGTIQSVIDGLADLTDGTAQTLTLHADVIAKLTDEQLTAIAQKNWNVA